MSRHLGATSSTNTSCTSRIVIYEWARCDDQSNAMILVEARSVRLHAEPRNSEGHSKISFAAECSLIATCLTFPQRYEHAGNGSQRGLKRHIGVTAPWKEYNDHAQAPSNALHADSVLGRAACSLCHQRKVRCDAYDVGFPCSKCRQIPRADCKQHLKKRRVPSRPSSNPTPLRPNPSAASLQSSSCLSVRAQEKDTEPNTAENSRHSGVWWMTGDPVEGRRKYLVEFIDQEDLRQRPIDKEARVTYLGTDVSNINFLVRQNDSRTVVHHFPTNRIDRIFTAHEPDHVPVEAFQLPEKAIVDDLLVAYFSNINPGFPVVDEQRFMMQYNARDPADPPSLLLLHAILLVGAHVIPGREACKAIFFRRAKILIDSRFERNRDVIVQAALLLTWHSDGLEDVAANAWHWLGFGARVAVGLGMHRDVELSTLVQHNKRMWRRVWWLLVQCDLLIALQYGRPPAINLDDCDVQLPQRSDYEECGQATQVDYAIAVTELCNIIRRTYRKCSGPRASTDRKSVLAEADQALARWSLLLPHRLRLCPTSTVDIWPATLHLLYYTVLILFHRPRPQLTHPLTPSCPSNANDAEICSAAAGTIQSIFESLSDRGALNRIWVFGVNALFTAMIQISVEVRFSNPLLAIAASRRYDSALHSIKQLSQYWPHAESILHFFEHSQRLRRHLHMDEDKSDTQQLPPSSYVNDQGPATGQLKLLLNLRPTDAAGQIVTVRGLQSEQHPEVRQNVIQGLPTVWKQLIPFADMERAETLQDRDFLEHWRELYWQEPIDLPQIT